MEYPTKTEEALESSIAVPQSSPPPSKTKSFLLFLWSQWFLWSIGITIMFAYLFPSVAKSNGYLKAEYTFSYGALAIVFLISGLTMPTKTLIAQLTQYKIHIITQSMCFLITPCVGLAIVEIIIASGTGKIPQSILAGIVIMLCTPTTVASNITFTRICRGDDSAALVEVTIGNLLGIFISPALVQLLLRPQIGLGFGAPTKSVGSIYVELIKHFGLALYLPFFVGQIVRHYFQKEVEIVAKKLRLPKWGSFALLALLWETFSNTFASKAFQAVPPSSIILVVFLNLALYPMFTLMCYLACRPPYAPKYWVSKGQTTAVCFCGPPKSITVGVVLISIQYSNFPAVESAILSIPLALYQGMQVAVAQFFIPIFRHWNEKK